MSDTPRTDAVYEQNKAHWSADMMTPFARQLERELAVLSSSLVGIASQAEFTRELIREEARLALARVESMRREYEEGMK